MSIGPQLRETMMDIHAPLVKENEEMILVDAGDGETAVWYSKPLCDGLVYRPSGAVTFRCTRNAAVRSVRLK